MVLKIQFHLKVVKFLGNYFTMFLKKIACLKLTWEKLTKISQKYTKYFTQKRNVPAALPIFHESTSAALTSYLPDKIMRQNFWNFLTHGGLFGPEKWKSWNWTHWIHSCYRPLVEKLLYILQAKLQKNIWKRNKSSSCCKMHITSSIDMENPYDEYLNILIQGGLTIASVNLMNYLCEAFVVLSAFEIVLANQWKLTSINAAKEALSYMMVCCNFTCENHEVDGQKVILSTIVNVLFNNKQKVSTEAAIRGILWKRSSLKFYKIHRKTPVPGSLL